MGEIGVAPENPENPSEAMTVADKNIYLNYNKSGKIYENNDNLFNLQNTLVHEDKHRQFPGKETNMKHIDVVFGQIDAPSWESTTDKYKSDRTQNIVNFFNGAINENVSLTKIQGKLDDANNLIDKTGYIFTYDQKSNSVSRSKTMNTFNKVETK